MSELVKIPFDVAVVNGMVREFLYWMASSSVRQI
jgi:hypothetical protein